MLQRTPAPPRGPRVPSYRGGRGGIQKRRAGNAPGPVRVDKDGDLVMDASSTDEKRSGRGQIGGSRSAKGPGSGRVPTGPARGGGNAGMQRTQRSVMRGMGTKQVNVHDTRNHPKMATLEIKGLGSSKAASNPDGGIESLLSFLERKASGHDNTSNRAVKIKKVRELQYKIGVSGFGRCCGLISFEFKSAIGTEFRNDSLRIPLHDPQSTSR